MKNDSSIIVVTDNNDTISRIVRILSGTIDHENLTVILPADALESIPGLQHSLLILDIPSSAGPAYPQIAAMAVRMAIPCICLLPASGTVRGIPANASTAITLEKPLVDELLHAAIEAARLMGSASAKKVPRHIPLSTNPWEERYRLLFDSSRDAILILDGMTMTNCNQAAIRLFQFENREELLGRGLLELVPSIQPGGIESRTLFAHSMENTSRSGWSFMKLTVVDANRQLIPTEIIMHGFTEGDTRRVQAMIRDISGRQIIEDRLTEGEEIAQALVSTPTEPVLLMNVDGTIINLNQELSRRFGILQNEAIGRSIYDYLDRETSLTRRKQVNTVVQTRMALRYEECIGEDWYDTVIYPIPDMNGHISRVAVFSRDITEMRRMQKEIMEISELERKRIGQDLHDSLGQKLTGVAFLAQALRQTMAEKDYPEIADIQEIIDNITDSIEQTRKISRGLWSIPAENIGIAEALEELAADTAYLFGVTCRCTNHAEDIAANPSIIANLYYIARESINNAIRHGKARSIDVDLSLDGGDLILEIRDNGKGQPPGMTSDGIGLRIMNYRAGIIGGTFEAGNAPGGGFRVFVRVRGISGRPPA